MRKQQFSAEAAKSNTVWLFRERHAMIKRYWRSGALNVSDEDKKNFCEKLGPDLGEVFYYLRYDLFRLRYGWRIYSAFFEESAERIDLWNKVSGPVSSIIAQALFEATLLGLRRITDDAGRNSNKNVSLYALLGRFDGEGLEDFQDLVAAAKKKSNFARTWSSKKIAHADLSLKNGNIQLEPASKKMVEDAISAVWAAVNWFAKKKLDAAFIAGPMAPAAELRLLRHLFEGDRALTAKENLSREYARTLQFDKRDQLYDYPDWLQIKAASFTIE